VNATSYVAWPASKAEYLLSGKASNIIIQLFSDKWTTNLPPTYLRLAFHVSYIAHIVAIPTHASLEKVITCYR
jgi:hypothetical protein